MPSLAEFQRDFARDLIRDASPETGTNADPAFNVYRNTWRKALRDALKGNYPVVAALIGEDAFHRLASDHIANTAAPSPIMATYGEGLDQTIGASPLQAPLPYLADMARLEWLVAQARNAAGAEPIDPRFFATLAPEQAESLTLKTVPAAHLARFETPVVTIWHAHQGPDRPASLSPHWNSEQALIVRQGSRITVNLVDDATFAFAAALMRGETLGQVAADTMAHHPDDDIGAVLTCLAASVAFTENREETS